MDADKALEHAGHNIEIVFYRGPKGEPVNVAVECVDCYVVIVDEDVEPRKEES